MQFENNIVKLVDICTDVSYGYTASANAQNVGPKFLRITDIQGGEVEWDTVPYCEINNKNFLKNKLERGDIVVARTGNSTGENYLYSYERDSVFASYLIRFRINSKLANPYFVWLQMRTKAWWDYVSGSKSGSAQAGANAKILGQFEFYLPDRKTQDKVSSIICDTNQKLTINRQANQTLEAIAQTLFKSWFVDFDPVKAKLSVLAAGGSAEEAERAAMCAISARDEANLNTLQTEQPEAYAELARTAALFPSAMQDSELGEIPAGWEISQIKDFGAIVCGKTPSKSKPEFYGSYMPFIKIPDMHTDMLTLSPSIMLSEQGVASQPKKTIPPGSVCVSCIATVGKVVITSTESQTNQQINSIVPKQPFMTLYLYFYMLHFNKHFHDLASSGSATLNMNTSTFSNVKILSPKDEILKLFSNKLDSIQEKIEENLGENISLCDLRDSLLPKLLSGECTTRLNLSEYTANVL